MKQAYTHWTPADDAKAKELKEAGKNAREIGFLLNKTRNSVIGRMNRLGLSLKGNHIPKEPIKEPRMRTRKLPSPKVEAPDESQKVTIEELQFHHCRWPIGDPREPGFGFCGHQKMRGETSYCEYHYKLGRTTR